MLDHWALPLDERATLEERVSGVARSGISPSSETIKPEQDTKSLANSQPSAEEVERIALPAEAAFLNEIHAGGCKLFGTALGPRANAAHKNHFHYDLAERRNGNFCQ